MPFTNKVTLGTYISDGLRTGPVLPGTVQGSNSTYSATAAPGTAESIVGQVEAVNYGRYGNSVLLSPQNTYSIVPFNGAESGIPNIFALQTGPISAGIIPLFAGTDNNNPASILVNSPTTGNNYIQFDYPRVPGVIVTSSSLVALDNVRIVFRGTDGYGFPIAHQYTLTDTTDGGGIMYPLTYLSPVNGGLAENTGTWACNVKAFDTITEVELLDDIPEDVTILGIATNMFGLPYKCFSPADIINFAWGGQNMKDMNGAVTMVANDPVQANFYTASIQNPAIGNWYSTERPLGASYINQTGVNLTIGLPLSDNTTVVDFAIPSLQYLLSPGATGITTVGYFNAAYLTDVNNTFYIPYANLPVIGYTSYTLSGVVPHVTWELTNGGYNLIQYADESEPSLTSGDPRGVVRVPSPNDYYGPLWSSDGLYPMPDGYSNRLEFTQYVYGADAFQNQLSASGYLVGEGPNAPLEDTVVIPQLDLEDLYGAPPFSGT